MKVFTDLLKSLNSQSLSLRRKNPAVSRQRSVIEVWSIPVLLILTTVLGIFIVAWIGMKPSWSYLGSPTKTKTVEMGLLVGNPAGQPSDGTRLEAALTASGFSEQQANGHVTGVNLEACATNLGDAPTQNLAILAVIQTKTGQADYANYQMAMVDVSSKPVLEPSESHCYPARILFDPVEAALYRASIQVTISNYAGWITGSANCPGPVPCAIGDQLKTDFTLAAQPYSSSAPAETSINGASTAVGYSRNGQSGVEGQVCVSNTGFELTLDLTIHNQVLLANGEAADYQEVSGAEQMITPDKQLGSRETACYPYQIDFLAVSEAHYRTVSWVGISNYTGWLPGGQNCSGPVPCMAGIQLQSDFDLAVLVLSPNPTTTRSSTRTSTTTRTQTPVPSSTLTSTGTPPGPPDIEPSETSTSTSTRTPTDYPTSQPTVTVTRSPSATPSATHTPIPRPTETWTLVPSATPYPTSPPTHTPTVTDTPVPSDTPIPPTDTAIPPTNTLLPPTDTAIPPTETAEPSPTNPPEPTLPPDPSQTP